MAVPDRIREHGAMARFLLTTMPFTGHVAPMATVAARLVERGHDVRFYTGSALEARVAASGARLVPWQHAPDFDENDLAATFPRLVGKKGMRQLLVNMVDCFIATAPAQAADLAAEWEREPWDLLAADETSMGAVLFAEQRDLRRATVAVVPLNLGGPQGPPSGMGITPGTNAVTRTRDAALRALVPLFARTLHRPINAARAELGLAPTSLTMDKFVFSPELVVASGGPLLDYGRADRPEHLHFVGELRQAESAPGRLPSWWGDLEGRTVVHVTQGTQNIDPTDLIRPAVEALAERDVLVVVATGIRGRDELPFDVPANVRVAGILPYAELLPRADLVVTNGGWGGTLAALARDVPLVVAGGDLDKPEVAARVAWSGAGLNLKTGTPTSAAVGAAVHRVLTHPEFRDAAARVGEQLRSLGGATHAAELLEGLLA
jgi:MGT family glycosyltransferase